MNNSSNIPMPKHIAIIMDGSGRWAQEKNKSRHSGHNAGAVTVRKTVEFAVTHGIESLSLYAFSKENWNRPEEEVKHLMRLFMRVLTNQKKFLNKHNVQLRAIGDVEGFSPDMQQALAKLVAQTSGNTGLILNVALNYSGKWDISNACAELALDNLQQLSQQIQNLTEAEFSKEAVLSLVKQRQQNFINRDELALKLDTKLSTYGQAEIDLIIRTSNEQRLSNFFLWQAAYSEFVFVREYWPDFDHQLFMSCIEEFNRRTRRFGGL